MSRNGNLTIIIDVCADNSSAGVVDWLYVPQLVEAVGYRDSRNLVYFFVVNNPRVATS